MGGDDAAGADAAAIEAARAAAALVTWALDRAPYVGPLDAAAWDTVGDTWTAIEAIASSAGPPTGGTTWSPAQEAADGLERIARRLTAEPGSREAPESLRTRAAAWLARPRLADPATTWDWETWRASLSPRRRRRADEVLERLRALGLQDPEESAIAELRENEPRLARFTLLRRLWRELMDPYHDPDRFAAWIHNMTAEPERFGDAEAGAAVRRLLALGADSQDLRRIARSTVWDTVFHVLAILDGGEPLYDPPRYPDIDYDAYPRWTLMEADASGRSTGRRIERLHEDFGSARSDIWRDGPSDG